jgi:3-hydroxyacyl-[acyl-carrier-protein] dehydratase
MAEAAIDSLRDSSGRLDRAALRSILPYGDDFLFVDEVTRLTEEEIEASYTVPTESPFIRAHFEGLPIMPGVLIGEGMAQAGALVVRYNLEDHQTRDILAFQIDSARFTSPARPGDRLLYRVRLSKLRRHVARLEGEVLVRERQICKARIVLAIIERDKLRLELEALDKS